MKPRTIIGIVLALGGFACYGASAMVLTAAIDRKASQDETLRRTELACREQLVKFGRVTPRENNVVEIDFGEVKGDPRRALADVTASLAMCPGRYLQDSCLGVGCSSGTNGGPGAIHLTVRLGLGAGAKKS